MKTVAGKTGVSCQEEFPLGKILEKRQKSICPNYVRDAEFRILGGCSLSPIAGLEPRSQEASDSGQGAAGR